MRYKVLTMGCTPASGELTKALRPLFQHMPEVHVIHDDVIIATKDEAVHERILDEVLQTIDTQHQEVYVLPVRSTLLGSSSE